MKTSTRALVLITALIALLIIGGVRRVQAPTHASAATTTPAITKPAAEPQPKAPQLTHAQETWIYALEWCESHGDRGAINPKDRDNTPSYGPFQFKPDTFASLAKRYGIKGELMDYDAQRSIVEHMLLDKTITTKELRERQFPDCIQNKIGNPPR